ncbi:MAG: hypothetical protein JW795_02565 [Chitinivibrionales bacterium]|nr:hypothetical protein [Chitinivibrionales bacterium]
MASMIPSPLKKVPIKPYRFLLLPAGAALVLFFFTFVRCSFIVYHNTSDQSIVLLTDSSTVKYDNQTLFSDSTVIRWASTKSFTVFKYKIDTLAWSGEGKNNTVYSAFLDDTTHVFTIYANDPENIDHATMTLTFTIKALKDSAVYVYPRQQTVAGDTARIQIRATKLQRRYSGIEFTVHGCTVIGVKNIYDSSNAMIKTDLAEKTNTVCFFTLTGEPFSGDFQAVELTVTNFISKCTTLTLSDCSGVANDSAIALNTRGAFIFKKSEPR